MLLLVVLAVVITAQQVWAAGPAWLELSRYLPFPVPFFVAGAAVVLSWPHSRLRSASLALVACV
ncbi:MAG: hypothetical protein M3Y55_08945, partial [Pseudomonadota bacterium]|nr:hypothetical protein [Pseudomonadota bacterium]